MYQIAFVQQYKRHTPVTACQKSGWPCECLLRTSGSSLPNAIVQDCSLFLSRSPFIALCSRLVLISEQVRPPFSCPESLEEAWIQGPAYIPVLDRHAFVLHKCLHGYANDSKVSFTQEGSLM